MPLLILLLLALTAGSAVTLVLRGRGRPVPAVPVDPDPDEATGITLALALVLILGGGLVLAALAAFVRSRHGLIGVDRSVADWGDRHATGTSTAGLKLVTDLGETWLVAAAGAVVAWVDHRRTGNRGTALLVLVVIAGDKLLNVTIKGLVDRARPTLNPIAATLGPSFPSGHTSTAAAFWAAAALVAGRWCGPRGRALLTGAAVAVAVGVAASRVLLDVHWLTDVIGGLALGWAWFAACVLAFAGRLLRVGRWPAKTRASTDAGRCGRS